MVETTMAPDQRMLRSHLTAGNFRSGVARGRWRLSSIDWPHGLIAVTAAQRPTGPDEFCFRFECSDYPATPPTAQPWDADARCPLAHDRWPGGTNHVARAFNPGWNVPAIYIPCDRLAIQGHVAWLTSAPSMLWKADRDLTQYLRVLHDLLNSSDYSGVRGPAT
jgi:hypothetical protein